MVIKDEALRVLARYAYWRKHLGLPQKSEQVLNSLSLSCDGECKACLGPCSGDD